MGFTDDRRFIWAGGLPTARSTSSTSRPIRPSPKLVKTIADLADKTGLPRPAHLLRAAGPHAGPGAVQHKDKGGVTGMAAYNNKGEFIATHSMPTDNRAAAVDGYGYDLASIPRKNVMLTSSFTGYSNYMRPLGELVKDAEAMKNFGKHHGGCGTSRP